MFSLGDYHWILLFVLSLKKMLPHSGFVSLICRFQQPSFLFQPRGGQDQKLEPKKDVLSFFKLLFLFFIKSNTKIISFFHFYLNPIPFLLFFIVQILFWFLQSRRFDVPLEFFMPKEQDRERNKITEKNRLRLTKTTEISQTE